MTAGQVRRLTIALLGKHLPLGLHGSRYADAGLVAVAVAAVQGRRGASVCRQVAEASSADSVHRYLADRLVDRVPFACFEARLDRPLVARPPLGLTRRPLRPAIDPTPPPSYGEEGSAPDRLRRGEAEAGTTRVHCSASASAPHAGRRVTPAVTVVRADEARLDVLLDLRGRLSRSGVHIRRLYLTHMVDTLAARGESIVGWFAREIRKVAREHDRRPGKLYRLAGAMVRDLYEVKDASVRRTLLRGQLPEQSTGGDYKRFWMLVMWLRRDQGPIRDVFSRAVAAHPGGEEALRHWYDPGCFDPDVCELPVDVWVYEKWLRLARQLRSRCIAARTKREVADRARALAREYGVSPSVFGAMLYCEWQRE